jgi:hypothetical protein
MKNRHTLMINDQGLYHNFQIEGGSVVRDYKLRMSGGVNQSHPPVLALFLPNPLSPLAPEPVLCVIFSTLP